MIDWDKSAGLNNTTVVDLKERFEKYPKSNKKVWRVCDNCNTGREIKFNQYHDLCHKCSMENPEHLELLRLKSAERWSNPEAKEAARLKSIVYWSDQDNRDEQSELKLQYHIDNPEAGHEHSERMKKYCSDPKVRDAMRLQVIKHFSDPEKCKEMSRIKTEYWSDQDNRDAQSKRIIDYFSDQSNRDAVSEIITNSEAAKANWDVMRGGDDIVDHHMIYDHSDLSKNIMPMTRSMHTKLHRLFQKHGIIIPHINIMN